MALDAFPMPLLKLTLEEEGDLDYAVREVKEVMSLPRNRQSTDNAEAVALMRALVEKILNKRLAQVEAMEHATRRMFVDYRCIIQGKTI